MKKEWIVLILMLCAAMIAATQAAAHAETAEIPEVPEYTSVAELTGIGSLEEAEAYAKKLCEADFFQLGDLSQASWDVAELEDGAFMAETEQDGQTLTLIISSDGALERFDNGFSRWEEAEETDPEAFNDEAHDKWRERIDLKLIEPFVKWYNPAAMEDCLNEITLDYDHGMFFTGYHGAFEREGDRFLWFYTDAYRGRSVRMKFVIQVAPVMRIVFYESALEATLEGGNG